MVMHNAPKDVEIENVVGGKPYSGKVLAVIAPHADDFTIFCGGTVAKLINEGYTCYFIRTTNDEWDSYDYNLSETILNNSIDHKAAAKILGVKKCIDLDYRNHRLEETSPTELRGQLIYLFRKLKVDTFLTFDPADVFEENPDHYITGRESLASHWMGAGRHAYPEQLSKEIKPHYVPEMYFFNRNIPHVIDRVVDVSSTIETKIAGIKANRTMIAHMALRLKDQLASRNLRLPILGDDVDSAVSAYAEFFRKMTAEAGRPYGLEYAELFRYQGPRMKKKNIFQRYIDENSVPIK